MSDVQSEVCDSTLHRIELILDDDDFRTLQAEIMLRQVQGEGEPILPEGDSNLYGAIIAEVIRDLNEYRAIYDSEHPKTEESPDA